MLSRNRDRLRAPNKDEMHDTHTDANPGHSSKESVSLSNTAIGYQPRKTKTI